MADKKRKERGDTKRSSRNTVTKKSKKTSDTRRKKTGPHLPSSLKKHIESLNPTPVDIDEVDNDVYEYEEELPEEESRKNKRYDPVAVKDNDDLSSDFEDENVLSDDEDDDDDSGDEDGARHARLIQRITGETMIKDKDTVISDSELYPESDDNDNPSRDVVDGDGLVSINDLLEPLREKPEFASDYAKLRLRNQVIEKHARTVHAPLPMAEQAKVERKVAYEMSKKEVTKWQPIIKRNREAPTIFFDEKTDLGFSTIGAIASEFEPRTELERKMAALVQNDKILEAHKNDGFRLLELNKVSVEDEKERQNRNAKMRSLLFRNELKAKHVKKIKSKTYHRLLKKDRLKAESSQPQMDPEAAKEYAMKQERLRAEERMTLRHKHKSAWLQRNMQRGLDKQDEGTRAAVTEHFQRHEELTRKMNTMDSSSSSSDDSSFEDDDEDGADSDSNKANKILQKAKQKTLEVLEEDDEIPKSGLLSLPFMRRGLEKRKEETLEEVNLTVQEYEDSMKKLEDSDGSEDPKVASTSGRRVFGMAKKAQIVDTGNKVKSDKFYDNSDSDDDLEVNRSGNIENQESDLPQNDIIDDLVLNQKGFDTRKESVFKNFDEIVKNPGPKTTYEVSIFASDKWNKAKNKNDKDTSIKKSSKLKEPVRPNVKNTENDQLAEDSDTDNEGQMVDGILTSASKLSYELPSQEELIRQAFAGDDVEDSFEKDKQDVLNEENPEPEKPLILPGWGQWSYVQEKKGLPSWVIKKQEDAQRKKEEAIKRRRDAQLKNVIISEKLSKKAEKLHTKTLPYPFTSKEVYDQNMRMPIGPEFNPATTIGLLNRPAVVKKPGVIIKPIEFEEVNPHDKSEHGFAENKFKKTKSKSSKSSKKSKN
ncbi:uncharacterized protein C57A7.06 [Vicia villosa]|uniref:uncharacterized protein C57A7.06 n=1 Tax=Vicia villosa TaxID=3911 RepID=UPI00273AA2EF|nr:uncharacterized protein C57A7.06 [Vicia villosa]